MYRVFIAGAGTIGTLAASLLVHAGDYQVHLVDNDITHLRLSAHENLQVDQLDVTDADSLRNYLTAHNIQAVIASLPYFHNIYIAKAAAKLNLHYFDLTEDTQVAAQVRELAHGKSSAFVSQCGVAPGFINIMANHLIQQFDTVQSAYLRAGCLPRSTHNALQYAITWSLDGLINEYGNPCNALVNGKKASLSPLEDLEVVELDGMAYEAFNTSGGIGSLVDTYENQVSELNYKTLRYPGHCDKIRFLMQDLHLNEDRVTLKQILEKSLPRTDQDVMLIYVAVNGLKAGHYIEQNYVRKIEPQELYERKWSAIQISTASSLCAVVDLVMHNAKSYQGFILQENFSLTEFLQNRFGAIYSDK